MHSPSRYPDGVARAGDQVAKAEPEPHLAGEDPEALLLERMDVAVRYPPPRSQEQLPGQGRTAFRRRALNYYPLATYRVFDDPAEAAKRGLLCLSARLGPVRLAPVAWAVRLGPVAWALFGLALREAGDAQPSSTVPLVMRLLWS